MLDQQLEHLLRIIRERHLNGGAFVQTDVQKIFEQYGFHLSTTHFYSPITSLEEGQRIYQRQPSYHTALKHTLGAHQWQLLESLLEYIPELQNIPAESEQAEFYWNNPMFPPLDAIAYYGLLRAKQPRRVIEIGSGFSTLLALQAKQYQHSLDITCIEPYPIPALTQKDAQLTLLTQVIEETNLSLFEHLQAGDFLFIDTSHMVKLGADVNFIVFEILPRLAPGVWIHWHDIFLPYEYPESWLKDIGIQWNEQYIVAALLANPSGYIVQLMNYWLSQEYEQVLQNRCQHLPIWQITNNLGGARGASLWIIKQPVR
ncbi:class I SAM-dependent methyltransferase [Oscillatoria sp. CS-180]|uniref:class I SAM-dependent methyltransferase n=1 Tax=Oscillatoria sp. CS-180 TaxID=3021720 RepID=UPI00232EE461|nr:class I SAM-dependent methyltransferase [Oscillatoria sp. CS-180]MDB9527019.1 class I SAM-dependent methyltransferase [Oscillatoria sp. CS-180]